MIPSKWVGGLQVLCLALLAAVTLQAQDDFISEEDLFEDDFEEIQTISDPLIGLNRSIFKFNHFVYMKILGPVAQTYRTIAPDPVEQGFYNFFDNLKYPVRLAGNLLQFKIEESFQETGKFLVNTTIGVAGFHKASDAFPSLNPPVEDLGQAFGSWGIGEGFYIVIPFLGPSNLRDLIGRYGDRYPHPVSDPWTVLDDSTDRFIVNAVDFVTDSPRLLYRYQLFTESAIDPYEAMKDGFTQYRMQQIKE